MKALVERGFKASAIPAAGPSADSGAALLGVGQALGRLRAAVSLETLFRHGTAALCESVGFERAAVFSLQGRKLVAESVYERAAAEDGERALAELRLQTFGLGPWAREAEVLRRRKTLLVREARTDAQALGLLPGTRSYVAAPVICHEQAVGLVHADRGFTGEAVTEIDRDTLRTFAEGFGYALEHWVLAERLCAHSERVRALVRSIEASVSELSSPEFDLHSSGLSHSATASRTVRDHGLHSLLTRRELEVVGMLAEGETNARIAQRLVVSEDTVKSHVKHILRKLGVHNRSQAVSRYFQAQAAS